MAGGDFKRINRQISEINNFWRGFKERVVKVKPPMNVSDNSARERYNKFREDIDQELLELSRYINLTQRTISDITNHLCELQVRVRNGTLERWAEKKENLEILLKEMENERNDRQAMM